MNETLINCDLDVQNAIKTIPKHKTLCAFYVRGEVEFDKEGDGYDCKNHVILSGGSETLTASILNQITTDELFRDLVLDAVLNYLSNDEDALDKFNDYLDDITEIDDRT
jgi:hypothetical protein